MLIGIGARSIQPSVRIIEPIVNREASNYIVDHYKDLLGIIIKKCDVKEEKAEDLLLDVFISIVESEQNGNGFNMEYSSKETDDNSINLITVEQFVIGRIKLYAKNNKYRTDIIEASAGSLSEHHTYLESEIGKNGMDILDKNGNTKYTKKVEHHKVPITVTINAASFNDGGDISENNDDFQKAFATAAIADSTDEVNEKESLREQIEFCIDVCSLNNFNILNIFKNIDTLSSMLGDYSKKKKTAEGVFEKLTELVTYHEELGDTIMDILRFSANNRAEFEAIISTY